MIRVESRGSSLVENNAGQIIAAEDNRGQASDGLSHCKSPSRHNTPSECTLSNERHHLLTGLYTLSRYLDESRYGAVKSGLDISFLRLSSASP
jgi:hypothetical protein